MFGRGDIEFLHPENPRVLAFLRRYGEETVVVVANLSRFSQFVELDLNAFGGSVPVELFGRTGFPRIGEGSWVLTLGPHSFYWFELVPSFEPITATGEGVPRVDDPRPARCPLRGADRLSSGAAPLRPESGPWFRSRCGVRWAPGIPEVVPLGVDGLDSWLATLAVDYSEGEPERYVIPLAVVPDESPTHRPTAQPSLISGSMTGWPRSSTGCGTPNSGLGRCALWQRAGEGTAPRRPLAGTPGEGIDADRISAGVGGAGLHARLP